MYLVPRLRLVDTVELEREILVSDQYESPPVGKSMELLNAYAAQGQYDMIEPSLLELEKKTADFLPTAVYNAGTANKRVDVTVVSVEVPFVSVEVPFVSVEVAVCEC